MIEGLKLYCVKDVEMETQPIHTAFKKSEIYEVIRVEFDYEGDEDSYVFINENGLEHNITSTFLKEYFTPVREKNIKILLD